MADAVTIVMSAEEAKLWQSIASTVSKMGQMERGFTKITDEARKSAKANQELERAAKGMLQSLQSPLDRHQIKLAEINRVYEAGKISVGAYSRLVRQLTDEYSRNSEAGRRAATAHQEYLARQRALLAGGPIAHRMPTAALGLPVTHRMPLIDLYGDFSKKVGEAGRAHSNFSQMVMGQLSGLALSYFGVAAAIGVVIRGIRDIQEVGRDAAQKQREAKFSMGSLAQVAEREGPESYAGLKAAAEKMYRGGAAETLEEAYRQVFEIKSAEQMEYIDLFTRLKQTRMIQQPGVLAQAASAMTYSFGREETGDLGRLISKGLAAAKIAPGTSETVLQAAAPAAAGAAELGWSDEELLAALGVIAKATGQTDEAGTRIESMVRGMQKIVDPSTREARMGVISGRPDVRFNLKGKNLLGQLREIESKNLSAGDLMELYGRKEAVQSHRLILKNAERYEALLGDIREADKGGELEWRLGIQDPTRTAEVMSAQAKAREELSRKERGMATQTMEGGVEHVAAEMREGGVPEAGITATRAGVGIGRFVMAPFGGDAAYMQLALGIQTALSTLADALRANTAGMDQMNRKWDTSGSGAVNRHTEEAPQF